MVMMSAYALVTAIIVAIRIVLTAVVAATVISRPSDRGARP